MYKILPPKTKILFLSFISIFVLLSNSFNPNNGNTGAPGEGFCGDCHGGSNPSFDGDVSITGLPATVMAGMTYPITVTVDNPNGAASRAGFQMTALDAINTSFGSFSNPSANSTIQMQSGRSYFEHNPAQNFPASNAVSWTVDWLAPSGPDGETVTFYAAGVIGNGSGSGNDRVRANNVSATLMGSGAPLSASVQLNNNVSCFGGMDGSATAIGMDGEPPYNFMWDNGETTATASSLSSGMHSVTVSDAVNASEVAMLFIGQPNAISVSLVTSNDPLCAGDANGSIEVTAGGGTGNLAYNWSDGQTGQLATGLIANNYTVTVTDQNFCTSTLLQSLTDPQAISISLVSSSDPSCSTSGDGFIEVTASGGTGMLSYNWSDGQVGSVAGDLNPDTYTVSVTDQNQCIATFEQTINATASPVINLEEQIHPSCFNTNDGVLEVSVSNGQTPITYTWSNGETSARIENLAAGDYTVDIQDGNNCTNTASYTLMGPDAIVITLDSFSDQRCAGMNDGYIGLTISGGNGPYDVFWSQGKFETDVTSSFLDSLMPNTIYSVSIFDQDACQHSASYTIGAATPIISVIDSQSVISCFGENSGFAEVSATGGADTLFYQWTNGSTDTIRTDLSAGMDTVFISDANQCIDTLVVDIMQNDQILPNANGVNETVSGAADGMASVAPTGGVPPYTYLWSNSSTSDSLFNLSPGKYTVTVTDALMCAVEETVCISFGDCQIEVIPHIQNVLCFGESSGSIALEINNASPPLTIMWNNGMDNDTLTDLSVGIYSVSIEDAAGCSTFIENIIVSQPDTLTTTPMIVQSPECSGESTGIITAENAGGVPPYQYAWATNSMEDTLFNVVPGFYPYTVTDANECTAIGIVNLTTVDTIPPTIMVVDITLQIDADGNIPDFDQNDFDNGSFDNCGIAGFDSQNITFDCSDIGDNRIWVSVTDVNGLESKDSITVTIEDNISPTIECPETIIVTDCSPVFFDDPIFADNCPNVVLEVADGLPSGSVFPVGSTKVLFRATDAAGNQVNCSFDVIVDVDLAASLQTQDPSCFGFADGSLTLNTTGGNPPYSFVLDPPSNPDFLPAGQYFVTVTDDTNCSITDSFTLVDPPLLVLNGFNVIQPANSNSNDGAIITDVVGGDGTYTYAWFKDGVQLDDDTADLEDIGPGIYYVIITDGQGCTYQSIDITVDSIVSTNNPEIINNLKVYPNPAKDVLNIHFASDHYQLLRVQLFDHSGQLIIKKQAYQENRIDVSNFAGGLYMIQLHFDDGSTAAKKLIIMP